jgi:hypothetical protein
MKLLHVIFIVAAAVGVLYVGHMITSHQGSQILPGVGIGK